MAKTKATELPPERDLEEAEEIETEEEETPPLAAEAKVEMPQWPSSGGG